MKINMSSIKHNLNEEGITESVMITYSSYENNNSMNATVHLLPDHLENGSSLDDLGKKELDAQARKLVKSWF